jgi:anti-sigma-K factor RskA
VDIKEYISSGVIEAYVLGIATDDEVREIEQLKTQYPELLVAIQEQEELLGQYALAHSVAPPPQLKQSIWQAIQEETMSNSSINSSSTPNNIETPNISLNKGGATESGWRQYAMAASVALLVASAAGNVWMMSQNKKMGNDIAGMSNEMQRLSLEVQQATSSAEKANEALAVLSLPSLKKINLAGVGSHVQHSGMLYWDGATGDVFLDLNSMPAAPEGKQYQLWAIVDGKPVDAGMYVANSGALMEKMKTIPKAEMFAITIEKMGGSPTPTLDQMVVAGKTI